MKTTFEINIIFDDKGSHPEIRVNGKPTEFADLAYHHRHAIMHRLPEVAEYYKKLNVELMQKAWDDESKDD